MRLRSSSALGTPTVARDPRDLSSSSFWSGRFGRWDPVSLASLQQTPEIRGVESALPYPDPARLNSATRSAD